jgi:hypothetical protein
MTTIPTEFSLKVIECVDRGLGALGEAARRLVYWFLETKSHLKKEEIPDDPTEFVGALGALFGQGAGLLEKRIIKELEQTFNLTLGGGETFAETLTMIRAKRQASLATNRSLAGKSSPRRLS